MSNSAAQRIGTVTGVETDRITIDLDESTTGLVKAGPHGITPVGVINSYLVIPSGPQHIVAVVSAIRIKPSPRRAGSKQPTAPGGERQLEATLVGRLEGVDYQAGVTSYPPLFAPVLAAGADEVACILRPPGVNSIPIGNAMVASDYTICIDADAMLGHHCAVLGSTGSGKSCTITALLDGLLELQIPSAHIVIVDSNGEYARAFAAGTPRGELANALVLGPQPGPDGGLVVPHWFMNNEDHLALLQAGEGAQAPLLQRAVADARLASIQGGGELLFMQLRLLRQTVQDIRASAAGPRPHEKLLSLLRPLPAHLQSWATGASDDDRKDFWTEMADAVAPWQQLGLMKDSWDPLTLPQRETLESILASVDALIRKGFDTLNLGASSTASDFDAPRYYSFDDLFTTFLPNRIDIEAAREPRIQNYAATMMMRLNRFLADSRYDFLTRVQYFDNALGGFLRLALGVDPANNAAPWGEAYRDRAPNPGRHLVTILDLSLIASDVLEHVTALIGRLLLEFAQRVEPRGSYPILLVLEEAHRYVPARSESSHRSRSAAIFERIAKEGRKFGVALLAASQRPSELSPTLLAQCGTLIVHRVASADDQELIRHATAVVGRDVLRQLPGLATQHAVVLGEAVCAPTYIRVRDVANGPRSEDPAFIDRWRDPATADAAVIDRIAHLWEEGSFGT